MKMGKLSQLLTACIFMMLGSVAQAADFNCLPASLQLKTTDHILNLLKGSMPYVVREGKNRKSTLGSVRSITASGCNIEVKFNAKLERKKKVIKKKRVVYGVATVVAQVNRYNSCLVNPKFKNLEYAKTTEITEHLIKNAYNRRMPSKICPDGNGGLILRPLF